LWGVERDEDEPVDVMVDDRRGRRVRIPGVELHRPRDRGDLRPVYRSGVPATPPLRMLADLGAVDPNGVYAALGKLVVDGTAKPLAVVEAVRRHASRGRAGIGALRRALDRYPLDRAAADSWLEIRMAELIQRFGLPPVEFHAMIAGWEVDFLISGSKVVLECDGRQHFLDPEQVSRDARRDEELLAKGYVTVRFTRAEITSRPRRVAERILAQLVQWAPQLLPTPASGARRR
jgi:very-short-patch-repair endonuclease